MTAAAATPDDRVPRTMMWAVVALCWLGIWSVVRLDPAAHPVEAATRPVESASTGGPDHGGSDDVGSDGDDAPAGS